MLAGAVMLGVAPAPAPAPVPAEAAQADASEPSGRVAGARAAGRRGVLVKVRGTPFGKALVRAAGRAFYMFDREKKGGAPKCFGACARVWPPVLTKGRPRAGRGVRASRLGTVGRGKGRRQLTFAGRPLYFYVHDTRRQILCHDVFEFGGRWLVIGPGGKPL